MAERVLDAKQRVATLQFEKEEMLTKNADLEPLRRQVREFDERLDFLEQDVLQYQGMIDEARDQRSKTENPGPDLY
eukprot:2661461-Lingulodinium_polyedra.AAC.1